MVPKCSFWFGPRESPFTRLAAIYGVGLYNSMLSIQSENFLSGYIEPKIKVCYTKDF